MYVPFGNHPMVAYPESEVTFLEENSYLPMIDVVVVVVIVVNRQYNFTLSRAKESAMYKAAMCTSTGIVWYKR